jgi:hypothetical protein
VTIYISGKNIISAIATVCVILIAVIAVAASLEHIKAWHGFIVLLGCVAVAGSIIQMFWQSRDDGKQKEMMTALYTAVVKSETKTQSRQQERAVTEIDFKTDPMVYVEIEDKRSAGMNPPPSPARFWTKHFQVKRVETLPNRRPLNCLPTYSSAGMESRWQRLKSETC